MTIIKLFDGTEITCQAEQGEKLEAMILADTAPKFIKVGGMSFRPDQVVDIRPGGIADKEKSDFSKPQIGPDQRMGSQQYSDARKAADIARAKLTKMGIVKKRKATE